MKKQTYFNFANYFPLDHSGVEDIWERARELRKEFEQEFKESGNGELSNVLRDFFTEETAVIIGRKDSNWFLDSFFQFELSAKSKAYALMYLISEESILEEKDLVELENYFLDKADYKGIYELISAVCETEMLYMVEHIDKFLHDIPEELWDSTMLLQVEAFKKYGGGGERGQWITVE